MVLYHWKAKFKCFRIGCIRRFPCHASMSALAYTSYKSVHVQGKSPAFVCCPASPVFLMILYMISLKLTKQKKKCLSNCIGRTGYLVMSYGPRQKEFSRLSTVLMRGHNIRFGGELTKKSQNYFQSCYLKL